MMDFGQRLVALRASLAAYYDWSAAHPDADADQVPPHLMAARLINALENVTGHAARVMEVSVQFLESGQPTKAAEILRLAIADYRERRPKVAALQ